MEESWTSLKLIRWTTDFFEKKGIPNPRLDAELLLAHALKCQRIDLYTAHERKIPEKELAKYRTLVERRAKREPLQQIIGETEFYGLKIKVTPDVLIPRPETELLVEEGLKLKARDILEIGTGSGCLAVALAKNLPEARVVATDISEKALAVARENAKFHGVEKQIKFILADIAPWKAFKAEEKKFDLIVSNPPYIPTGDFESLQPEVRDFEPRGALEGGPEGLSCIRQIIEEAPSSLNSNGFLVIEIGEDQSEPLRKEWERASHLLLQGFRKDWGEIERIVIFKKR